MDRTAYLMIAYQLKHALWVIQPAILPHLAVLLIVQEKNAAIMVAAAHAEVALILKPAMLRGNA